MPICWRLGDNGSQQTLGKWPCEARPTLFPAKTPYCSLRRRGVLGAEELKGGTCERKSRPDVHLSATSANPAMASLTKWDASALPRHCEFLAIKGSCKANLNSKRVHDPNRASAGSELPKLLRCLPIRLAVTPAPTRIHTRGSSHGECMPTVRVWLSSSPYWGIETCGCTERVMCGSTVYLW